MAGAALQGVDQLSYGEEKERMKYGLWYLARIEERW